jgi:phosphate transport system substrate-binding protein
MTVRSGAGRVAAVLLVLRWAVASGPAADVPVAATPAADVLAPMAVQVQAAAPPDTQEQRPNAGTTVLMAATNLTPPFAGTLSLRVTGLPVELTQVDPGTPAGRPATDPGGRRHAEVFTGTLSGVTVQDTRPSEPGWTVTGQAGPFQGSAGTIPAADLGWTPALSAKGSDAEGTVTAGPAVDPRPGTPTSNGLARPGNVLATAKPGSGLGTQNAIAQVQLWLPDTTPAGVLAGTLTLTLVSS